MRPRDVLVPVTAYLGVMVVAPALRGAAREPAFWRHTAIVMGVAGMVVLARVLLAVFTEGARSRWWRR